MRTKKMNHKIISENYDFKKHQIIIFTFNECSLLKTGVNYNKLMTLGKKIEKYNNIRIINNPIFYKIFRSKLELYDSIKLNNIKINIALTKKLNELQDLEGLKFPCIIAKPVSAGGALRKLYNNKQDVDDVRGCIYIEYIESKLFDSHFCGRICAFNNHIIYYFPRFGSQWNVGISSQNFNVQLLEKGFRHMKKNFGKLQQIVNELTKLFKNSIYAADVIFRNNKWYLCEVGYKFKPYSFLSKIKSIRGLSPEFKITDKEYNLKLQEIIKNPKFYV